MGQGTLSMRLSRNPFRQSKSTWEIELEKEKLRRHTRLEGTRSAIEVFSLAIKQNQKPEIIDQLRANLIEQAKHEWGQSTIVDFHDGFIRIKLHSHFEDVPL
jgi:hypothetical protein